MNDRHWSTRDAETGDEHDTFTRALLDIAAGRAHRDEDLPEEHRQLLRALSDWLPDVLDVCAELRTIEAVANSERNHSRRPADVRPDDPIALMLGLVVDPAVRLDGRRLATSRKAAGLDIAQLAKRLNRRGWNVSIKTISAWERNLDYPPPATIEALAEELSIVPDTLLMSVASDTPQIDVLFDDAMIAAFLEDWARKVNVPAERLAEHAKRLLVTAGKRNATGSSPRTLLAVLRQFRNLPGFEVPG